MMNSQVFKDASALFLKIEAAPSLEESAPHVDAVWQLAESIGAPFKLFIPFLVQRNFPPTIFDRVVAALLKSDEDLAKKNENPDPTRASVIFSAKAGRAHLLMYSVCTFLSGMIQTRTAADNNTDVFTAATTIARAPVAFATADETGCFLLPSSSSSATISALEIAKNTVMGALLYLNMFKTGASEDEKIRQKMKWFPFSIQERHFDDRMRDSSDTEIQQSLKNQTDRCKAVIEACLRSNAENREKTFRFLAKILEVNRDYKKTQSNESVLYDRFSLVALSLAMIQLAQPIFGQREFYPRGLGADYLQDKKNPNAIVRYHENDDTLINPSDAPPLPADLHASQDAAAAPSSPASPNGSAGHHVYPPKYHIFFLAVRAFDLGIGSLTDACNHNASGLNYHVARNSPHAGPIAAFVGYLSSILMSAEAASLALRFADAVAEWLLFVSGADRDGNVAEVSPFWALLPQSIVDTTFQVLTLTVVECRELHRDPPLQRSGYFEFTNCVSLALLLMGNGRLLPKAFTHLQYPELFLYLLRAHGGNFRNHQWFVSHALGDCIECYIIVDSQEYDKINQRNILGEVMKDLLNDPQAVNAVRERFDAASDRRLEKLTKLMTIDADLCLDMIIKNLGLMHEIEEKIGNQIPAPGTEDANKYGDYRRGVRDGVVLSKTILGLFTRLLDQFKKGMAQHLVVAQVGQLLVTFLVKLAGPNSAKLKSLSAESVGFNPRELVELIVEAFIRFHDVPGFARYCVEGTGNMADYFDAVSRIKRLGIISSHLMMGLKDMETQMRSAEEEAKLDNSIYADPPDWAQCQVLFDLLTDPVELPGGGEDPIICDREAIRHQLLDRPFNPFNRQPLSVEELDEHNKKPEVVAKLSALMTRIEEWKAERRKDALQKKLHQDAAQ
jgi:hypothetical protein